MKQVRLIDRESILPQTLVFHLGPKQGEWDVRNIEIYDEAGTLLADDIQLDKLPPASQMRLLGYLNEWDHEQRQAAHRDAAAVRMGDALVNHARSELADLGVV